LLGSWISWSAPLDRWLFLLALAIYAATRLIRLADYPIYFFTDEAIQTLLARDFIRDGFRDFAGRLFPTYFLNVYEFNLNLSVYVQVLPTWIFGNSVFLTRAIPALFSVASAGAVGWVAVRFLRIPLAWSAILLLGISPAWFLHSRTAFETSLMASFYGFLLLFYLYYRERGARYLYPTLLFGALVFYTYGPGQIIALATAILLLLADAGYHWSLRRQWPRPALFAALLTLPYIRFQIQQPGKHQEFLRLLDSYWLRDISLGEKLRTAASNYLTAISPAYWFGSNDIDLARHVMGDYGNLLRWTAPLLVVGLIVCLARLRSPAHRVVLIALLAIPFGGVVVGVGITRLVSFAIPASLLSAIGLAWLSGRVPWIPPRHATVIVFTTLAAITAGFFADTLRNGPTWERNYGLYGMQYGARQVFQAAADHLELHPDDRMFISSSWANGVDVLEHFFLPDEAPAEIASVGSWLENPLDLNDQMVFLVTSDEYRALQGEPKFDPPAVLQVLPYPDGTPGFYLLRLSYSDAAPAIFAEEIERRRIPIVDSVLVEGERVMVQYPLLDVGSIDLAFDGDEFTLIRTFEANPALFILEFPSPRQASGISLTMGAFPFDVTLRAFASTSAEPVIVQGSFRPPAEQPTVELRFDSPAVIQRLEIEIFHRDAGDGQAKIHVREVRILPAP
jgi:4-amino-4-deoxy-L-arabinose transferase-like glycosyltransferase